MAFNANVLSLNNTALSEDSLMSLMKKPNYESYLHCVLEFNEELHRIEVADKISYYRQLVGQSNGALNEEAITESKVVDIVKLIVKAITAVIDFIKNVIDTITGKAKISRDNYNNAKKQSNFSLEYSNSEFIDYFSKAWDINAVKTNESESRSAARDRYEEAARKNFEGAENKEFTFTIMQYTDPSRINDSAYEECINDIVKDIGSIINGEEISEVSDDILSNAYRTLANKIRTSADTSVNNFTDPVTNDVTFMKFIKSNIVYSYNKKMAYSDWRSNVVSKIVPPDPSKVKKSSNALIKKCEEEKSKAEHATNISESQKENIKKLVSYLSSIIKSYTWYINYLYTVVNKNCDDVVKTYNRIKKQLYGFSSSINESAFMHGEPFDVESIWKDVDLNDFVPSQWLDLELTTECYALEFELLQSINRVALQEAIIFEDDQPNKFKRLLAMREAEEDNKQSAFAKILEFIKKAISDFFANLEAKVNPIGRWVQRNKQLVDNPIKSDAKSTGDIIAGMYRVQDPIRIVPFNYDTMKDELKSKEDFFKKHIMSTLNANGQFSKRNLKWEDGMTIAEYCKAYYGASMPQDKYDKCEFKAEDFEKNKDNIVTFISTTRYLQRVNNDEKQLESQIKMFESKQRSKGNNTTTTTTQTANNNQNNQQSNNENGNNNNSKNESYYSILYGRNILNEIEMVKDDNDNNNQQNGGNNNGSNEAMDEASAFRTYMECYKDVITAKLTASFFIVNELGQVIDNHIKTQMSAEQKQAEQQAREKENPQERKNNPG